MANTKDIIEQLAVNNCPIVYFHSDEKYMPANFADMIKISDLYEVQSTGSISRPKITKLIKKNATPTDLTNDNTLISIKKNMISKLPLGQEIICRTKGIYKLQNDMYSFIDLLYIVYFAYNGTRDPHIYDQEFIIVRMQTNSDISDLSKWNMIKCFGSIHGGGLWHDPINLNKEIINGQSRIIFYSANESHAMYNKPGVYKRIFRFGDDITEKGKKWIPNKLICMIDSQQALSTNIYNYTSKRFEYNINTDKYYNFNGVIGNARESITQAWAGSNVYVYIQFYYDTLNVLPYSKYEGGISNLFSGIDKQISKPSRYALFGSLISIWIIIILIVLIWFYKVYKPLYKFTKIKLLKFICWSLFIITGFILYFIVCFYLGLDIFVINSNYKTEHKIGHLIMIDDELNSTF